MMKLLANINKYNNWKQEKKGKKKKLAFTTKKVQAVSGIDETFLFFYFEVCALLERTNKSLTLILFAKCLIASVSLCRDLYGEYIVETLRR